MPRSLQSLESSVPVEAISRSGRRSEHYRPQLWIAVCLPNLAIESLPGIASSGPAVVVEPQQGQLCVVAGNASACAAGIAPGCKLSAALALAASLQAVERAPRGEQMCLESLASWAQALTPVVSLEPPEGLLLEVAGSLKLFRSLDAIKAKLGAELKRRRLTFQLCAAPTATAALWLARAEYADVLTAHELSSHLGRLPLAVTRWPPAAQSLLRDLGARTIGECLRLPRDGFARRVGRAYLQDLDRALGRQFDVRGEFKAPEAWSAKVELGDESVDSAVFLEAVEQVLGELVAELRIRQAAVATLRLELEHLHRPPTVENFDLREPTHDLERLLQLVKDRMERSILPIPATGVRVQSGLLVPLELRAADLFEKAPAETLVQALLERLQGRFGPAAIHGLRAVAEHRPERAWARPLESTAGQPRSGTQLPKAGRPLWLLQRPLPLASNEARNHYRGSLELRSGPERIESGWWDEQDVCRDYYTAVSSQGQRLWVFKDRLSRAWHLHGLFG